MEIPMPSSAMEPTYRCGKPAVGCSGERADVLVVEPTRDVSRGDVIAYRATGPARTQCGAGGLFIHRVQRVETGGALYVVGDNRSQSCDSRVFGAIPRGNVLGKVVGVRRRF
jgi:type IV secretory pathway protease TraF